MSFSGTAKLLADLETYVCPCTGAGGFYHTICHILHDVADFQSQRIGSDDWKVDLIFSSYLHPLER